MAGRIKEMRKRLKTPSRSEKGMALVTTLMLSLLLSVLVGGMLIASTSDTLIGSNDVRNNQAFYLAEAGVNRAAGWFTANFGASPSTNLFVLPEKYLDSSYLGSNTTGAVGKLSYTTGDVNYNNVTEAAPYYKPGASLISSEQAIPTSVKTMVGTNLQNVVLTDSDTTTTYPASYTVEGLDAANVATTYPYSTVVSSYRSNLVSQPVGDGWFTVKATLISITPQAGSGMMTWLLQSQGTLKRGSTTIATATVSAYMSALVTPVKGNRTVLSTTQVVSAEPGVVARGMVSFSANQVTIDSYKSSKGKYAISLAANSYTGQIGSSNIGSRGDVRTNNSTINGVYGYINVGNGVITGNAYATDAKPLTGTDPITIDSSKVMYTQSPAVNFSDSHKYYGQSPLTFPDVATIPTATGTSNWSWSSNSSTTVPSGNWNNLSISKGTVTVPGGTYGTLNLSSQGIIVLGSTGQTTYYNFQGVTTGAQTKIIYAGPVVINVQSSLNIGGQGSSSDQTLVPPSSIHWNFKGGNGEVVQIGGGGDTIGCFYAPNNALQVKGGGDFYGAIAAQSVDINGNGAFHIDEDAVLPVTTTQTILITATITVGYTGSNYNLWRITQEID
jgi:PilX N-terminal